MQVNDNNFPIDLAKIYLILILYFSSLQLKIWYSANNDSRQSWRYQINSFFFFVEWWRWSCFINIHTYIYMQTHTITSTRACV